MTFLTSFATYAVVIVLSGLVVARGAEMLARRPFRSAVVASVVWGAVHVLVGVSTEHHTALLSSGLVLGSAVCVGTLLARPLGSRGSLITFAATASVVDVLSFSRGATRWLLSTREGGASRALQFLTVSLPTSEGSIPVVGIGDLALLATFYLTLRALGAPRVPLLGGLLAALLVALAVGLARGGAFGIPFMALVAIPLAFGATGDAASRGRKAAP